MRDPLFAWRLWVVAAGAVFVLVLAGCGSRKLTVVIQDSGYSFGNAVILRDARELPSKYPALFEPEVEVDGFTVTYTLKDRSMRKAAISKLRAQPRLGIALAEIKG